MYCRKHYKEYLVYKVNQNHIDPIPLYGTGRLGAILMRDEVKVPDQQRGEGEEQYAERLRQVFVSLVLPYLLFLTCIEDTLKRVFGVC